MKAKISALIIVLLVILTSVFFYFHFMPGFSINGVDVSFLSPQAAYDKITQNSEITLSDETSSLTLNSLDYVSFKDNPDTIKKILGENRFKLNGISCCLKADIDEDKLVNDINSLNANRTKSQDAYIDFDSDEIAYEIIPEVYGNEVDTNSVIEKIESDNFAPETIDLSQYYIKPAITSEDEDLNKKLAEDNKIFDVVITYELPDNLTEKLDKNTFYAWLNINDDKITFDDELIQKYVEDLASKTNTVGSTRTVMTQSGEKEIAGGTYGWKVDVEGEVAKIKEDVLSMNSISRRPVFAQEAAIYSKDDLGTTYVEVDIDNQHLYYIEDGQIKLESDVVTGQLNKADRHTTTGTHFIWVKDKSRYLNGPTWHVFVNRFMPFCGGQGFHDASWRGAFGGQIYKTNGSHGCINMPKAKVLELFDMVEVGCPVVIYSSNY